MYINWDKKFETGIKKIDKQHKELANIINQLHEDVIINKNASRIDEFLMDLKIYTINHFSTEEKMLKKYNYPDEENHIKVHQRFVNFISENLFDVTSGKLAQGYKITEFLKEWLLNHILVHDMEYVLHFKKQTDFLADIENDIL